MEIVAVKFLRDNNEIDGTEEIKDEEKMRMNRSQVKEKKKKNVH